MWNGQQVDFILKPGYAHPQIRALIYRFKNISQYEVNQEIPFLCIYIRYTYRQN